MFDVLHPGIALIATFSSTESPPFSKWVIFGLYRCCPKKKPPSGRLSQFSIFRSRGNLTRIFVADCKSQDEQEILRAGSHLGPRGVPWNAA
jgi:hypothetical protein